eukprot:jgi/Ulvmu1/4649/UM002_0380.1
MNSCGPHASPNICRMSWPMPKVSDGTLSCVRNGCITAFFVCIMPIFCECSVGGNHHAPACSSSINYWQLYQSGRAPPMLHLGGQHVTDHQIKFILVNVSVADTDLSGMRGAASITARAEL